MLLTTRSLRLAATMIGAFCLNAMIYPGTGNVAQAQVTLPASAKVDIKARVVLDQMLAAYRELKSYSGSLEVQMTGAGDIPNTRWNITFQKPDRIALISTSQKGVAMAISDGTTLYALPAGGKQYSKIPAPSGPLAVPAILNSQGPGGTLTQLISGIDPLQGVAPLLKSVTLGRAETVAGVAVDTVVVEIDGKAGSQPVKGSATFSIGKVDHLLRRVKLSQTADKATVTSVETHLDVKANPNLPASTFVFAPPPGTTLMPDVVVPATPSVPLPPAQIEPRARELLNRMSEVYKGLKSYSGTMNLQATQDGKEIPEVRLHHVILFQRPARFVIMTTDSTGTTTTVTDGFYSFARHSRDLRQYTKQAAPSGERAVRLIMRQAGADTPALPLLLAGEDIFQDYAQDLRSLAVGSPTTVAGVPVETVVAGLQHGADKATFTYFIGRDDHLLRRLTISTPKTATEPLIETTETHTEVRLNPVLSDAAFTFVPPAGARLIASLEPTVTTVRPRQNVPVARPQTKARTQPKAQTQVKPAPKAQRKPAPRKAVARKRQRGRR